MKISLLMGSGISVPSKVNGVDQITNKLLKGKWAIQNNKYIEVEEKEYRNDLRIVRIQKLLLHIRERYSNDNHRLNYEELFYVVDSLNNYKLHPHDNFIHKAEFCYFKKYFNNELKSDNSNDFDMVLYEILKFFQLTISYLLQKHDEIKGLELFDEIQEDQDVEVCNIFTLNHDVVLENYFDEKKVEYNTGFNEKDGDVYLFNYESLKSKKSKFRIIKLHGSINWFLFRQEPGFHTQARYGITDKELNKLKNDEGNRYEPLFNHPHFLSGTHNKIIDYSNSTFFELRYFFFCKLEQLDQLIVSGYGWRDQGIDQVIYNWLNKSKNNRLHFLYENIKDETDFRDYDFFEKRDQILNYGVYLQNAEWDNIKKNLL